MSTKTSTAALDSFTQKSLNRPCAFRATRPAQETEQARSDSARASRNMHVIPNGVGAVRILSSVPNVNRQEDAMRNYGCKPVAGVRAIFPVILRILFSLMLWTLGASMELLANEPKAPRERRIAYVFGIERDKVEDLQRWVNAGHDPWCRDAQLVATAALERVLPDNSGIELASLPVERENGGSTTVSYTFHTLDGETTSRVTLRRYDWLLRIAGSWDKMIWVPETAVTVTRELPGTHASAVRAAVV